MVPWKHEKPTNWIFIEQMLDASLDSCVDAGERQTDGKEDLNS